jgi:hypothetical protein
MPGMNETHTMNRLMEVNWRQQDQLRSHSQMALFREYLRRFAVWCEALDWPEAHPVMSDIPARINPDVQATPVNTTLTQQTMRTLGRTSVYERMMVTRALNLAAICDHMPEMIPAHLPDLYEPLLCFFERGGWVAKGDATRNWVVSGQVGQLDPAHAYVDLTPLDMMTLDLLD